MLLLLVTGVSMYYNSEFYYVQAAKKAEKNTADSIAGSNAMEKSATGKNFSGNSVSENSISEGSKGKKKNVKVVIDAGHGGFDPGKIGINQELEKDINLSVALKLQKRLEDNGITVVMTRHEDVDLGQEGAANKKKSDMSSRVALINEAEADLCVSIHQNSYSSEKVKGAQVFYYSGSDSGKNLAASIQNALKEKLQDGNRRSEKSNDSYYLLLKSKCPAVIVECGFLSNWEEATNLKDDYYQERLAEAICEGILCYLTVI